MSSPNVNNEGDEGEDEEEGGGEGEGEEEEENEDEGEGEEEGEAEDDGENEKKEPEKPKAILYTPEELIDKERRRIARSKCCLKEIWGIYSKLIDPLDKQKRMCLLKELEPLEQAPALPSVQEGEEIQDTQKEATVSEAQEGVDAAPDTEEGKYTILGYEDGTHSIISTQVGARTESNTRMETNAVSDTKIGPTAVSDTKIGPTAVSDTKIGSTTVSDTKIGSDVVSDTKIGSNAVSDTKMGSNVVSDTKIGANAVSDAKMGSNTISDTKMGSKAASNTKLGTNVVSDTKIGANAASDTEVGAKQVSNTQIGETVEPENQMGKNKVSDTEVGEDAKIGTQEGADTVVDTQEGTDAVLNTEEVADVAANQGRNTITISNVQNGDVSGPNKIGVPEIILPKEKSDGDIEKRINRLQEKHGLFKIALDMIKEAASQPFLRIEKPRFLDETGGRHHLLQVVRSQIKELEHPDFRPSTISGPVRHFKTSNVNFLIFPPNVNEGMAHAEEIDDGSVPESIADEQDTKDVGKEDPDAEFDFYEYPMDPDGNPLGKTTGFCHYCGSEILPLPLQYQLNSGYDINQFYCCAEYRIMHQDAEKLEKQMREKIEAAHALINITPGGKYNPKKAGMFPGLKPAPKTGALPGSKSAPKPGMRTQLKSPSPSGDNKSSKKGAKDKEKGKGKDKEKEGKNAARGAISDHAEGAGKKKPFKKTAETKGGGAGATATPDAAHRKKGEKGRLNKAHLKRSSMAGLGPNQRNKETNTTDLNWDPYETAYGHKRWFNEGEYFKPLINCYDHALVVLGQDELYDNAAVERPPVLPERARKSERKSLAPLSTVAVSRSRTGTIAPRHTTAEGSKSKASVRRESSIKSDSKKH